MKLKELQIVNKKVKTLAKKENKLFYYGRFIPYTKFVFIAEMPTAPKDWNPTDNFNLSYTDKIFLKAINDYGLGGSYITDIVKTTAKPRRPTKKELLTGLPLLAEELKYINPDVVVAVGKSAYDILDKKKEILNIKNLELIWHPARLRYPSNVSKFREQINKLSKKYTD